MISLKRLSSGPANFETQVAKGHGAPCHRSPLKKRERTGKSFYIDYIENQNISIEIEYIRLRKNESEESSNVAIALIIHCIKKKIFAFF